MPCVRDPLEFCAHRDGKCCIQMGRQRIVDKCNVHMCCAHMHTQCPIGLHLQNTNIQLLRISRLFDSRTSSSTWGPSELRDPMCLHKLHAQEWALCVPLLMSWITNLLCYFEVVWSGTESSPWKSLPTTSCFFCSGSTHLNLRSTAADNKL